MASSYQDLLDQYAANAGAASEAFAEEVPKYYQAVDAAVRNQSRLQQLSPNFAKEDAALAAAQTRRNLIESRGIPDRTEARVLLDTVIRGASVLPAITGSIGVLGAAGAAQGARALGANTVARGAEQVAGGLSTGTNMIESAVRAGQSNFLNKEADEVAAIRAPLRAESRQQYERDIKNGEGSFLAGIRRIGRDIASGFQTSGARGSVFLDEATGAVASLTAVAPIAAAVQKTAGAVGNPVLNAAVARIPGMYAAAPGIAAKAGNSAVYGAIGLMEGGGAAQGAMTEVMSMPHEELLEKSPEYRQLIAGNPDDPEVQEAAKLELATAASAKAGGVQSLLGAAISRVAGTGAFERAPMASKAGLASTSIRETVEEGAQGATGELSTNLAIQDTADETRSLTEGVGEGLAQGALYGSLTTGVVSGPGKILNATDEIAGAVGVKALDGLQGLADPVREAAYNVAEKIKNRREGVSSTVEQEAAEVSAKAPGLWADIKTKVAEAADDLINPEAKQKINDVTDKLASRVAISEQDIDESDPAEVQEAIKGSANRFDAVKNLAKLVESNKSEPETRVAAAASLARMLRDNAVVQDQAAAMSSDVEKLGETAKAGFKQVSELMSRMLGTKRIQRAMGLATSIMENVKPTKAATPANVKLITDQAELAPDKLDPETGENLLLQSEKGEVNLTPQQATNVRTAVSISRAAQQYKANRPNKATTIDAVSQALVTDDMKPGESLSAVTQARLVTEAVRSGNEDAAIQQLNRLRRFGELFQNKLNAINEHYRKGDGTEATAVEYQNLTKKGVWRPEKLWTNGQVPQSITLAQAIAADEQLVRKLTNDLIAEYPQLGFEALPEVSLDEELQGDIETVASTNRKRPRPFQRGAAATTMTVPQYVDKYIAGEGRDSPEMEQFAANNAKEIEAEFARRKAESGPKIYRAQAEASAEEMARRQEAERAKKERAAAAAPRKKGSDAKIKAAEAAGQQALPLEQTGAQSAESANSDISLTVDKTTESGAKYITFTMNGKSTKAVLNIRDGVADLDIYGSKPGSFGPGGMRVALNLLREQFPEITAVSGLRQTGARGLEGQKSVQITLPGKKETPAAEPTEREQLEAILNEKEPPKPANFIQFLRGYLESETERKGTNVRIAAEDAIDAGVSPDLIYNRQKSRNSRYRTVKVGLTDIFATRRGPLDSKAAPVILLSLDMAGEIDLDSFGSEGQTEELTETDLGALITASLEGDPAGFNKSDRRYEPYMDWNARIEDAQEALDKLDETTGAGSAAPTGVEQDSVEAAPVVPDAKDTVLEDYYPNVIGFFKTAFTVPKTPKTRILYKNGSEATPLEAIRNALLSFESLLDHTDKKPTDIKKDLSQEAVDEYAALLKKGDTLAEALRARMAAKLAKAAKGNPTWEELIRTGKDYVAVPKKDGTPGRISNPFLLPNNKAFNLLEEQDGKLQYNQQLLETVVVAAMHWLVNAKQFETKTDNKGVTKIFGIEQGHPDFTKIKEGMNEGLSLPEASLSLAQIISRYWGLSPNNETDQALIDGMAESMAKEVLTALSDPKGSLKLIDVKTLGLYNEGDSRKKLDRYIVREGLFKGEEGIKEFPSAIDVAVMFESEPIHYVGTPPTEAQLSKTQMNNPRVKNTRAQMASMVNDSSIPYLPNGNVVAAYEQAGRDGLMYLFGEGNLEDRLLNVNTARTLQGRNRTIAGAFDSLQRMLADMRGSAKAEGKTLEEMAIFFAHNFSSVGRMQMQGSDNPQASKLVREALLPTLATLDLTDPEQRSAIMLAIGQLLGTKVHNMPRNAAQAKEWGLPDAKPGKFNNAEDETQALLDGQLAPAVEILQTWLKSGKELTWPQLEGIKAAFTNSKGQSNLDPMSFHALMDYARMLNSSEAELKTFKSQLYVEADGVTNGPMNGIMMVTTGSFTADWFNTVSKGGVFFHEAGWTMNKHRSGVRGGDQGIEDKVDLYEKAAQYLDYFKRKFARKYAANPGITTQIVAVDKLLDMFLPDAKFTIDDDGNQTLTFKRGITKNPLTITLYGSGAKGIAGNIVGAILEEMYTKMSEGLQYMEDNPDATHAEALFRDVATATKPTEVWLKEFAYAMNVLTQRRLERDPDNFFKLGFKSDAPNSGVKFEAVGRRLQTRFRNKQEAEVVNFETFTMGKLDVENMAQNISEVFVAPMTKAIEATVGESVPKSMKAIQGGANIVSIFLKSAYDAGIAEAMKGKQLGEFLSRNEQEQIFKDRVLPLAPFLTNGDAQTFFVAGSQKIDLEGAEGGRNLDGKMETDLRITGIDLAGVSATPTLIEGMGDGYMMQLLSTVFNGLKKNLKVFDGINLSLDDIVRGSELANQAAFQAMMNNPVKVIADNFDDFIKNADVSQIDGPLWAELVKATFPFGTKPEQVTNQEMQWALQEFQLNLRSKSNSIEARHNVLRRVRITVDQMAAVGAPFEKRGDIDLTGLTDEQKADVLNREYYAELAKIEKSQAVSKPLEEVMASFGSKIGNVVEASQGQLRSMLYQLPLTDEQRSVLKETMESLIDQDYRVVVGERSDLQEFASRENLRPIKIADDKTGPIMGYISLDEKIIYVMDGTGENLVHEMVHASTFSKVEAFYKGAKVPAYVPDAVKRLEALMNQFMTLDKTDKNISPAERWAIVNAQAAIQGYLEGEQTPRSKAAALNEFMAWSLSNQALLERLGKTAAVEEGTIKMLAKTVLRAIKKLIFGGRHTTQPADDMLSNIRFNTNIIAYSDFNEAPGTKSVGNLLQNAAGLNSRVSRFTDAMGNVIYEHFEKFDLNTQQVRKTREERVARVTGIRTAQMFHNNGFAMSLDEMQAMNLIVGAMSTSAKLDANILNEVQDLFTHAMKNLKLADFAPTGPMDEQVRNHIAQQRYDAVSGNLSGRKDTLGRSTLLSSFLALSVVNEDFRKILEGVPAPKTEIGKWQGVNQILDNVGILGMDKLSAAVSGADRNAPNVRAALEALQDQMLELAEAQESRLEEMQRSLGQGFTSLNDGLVNSIKDGSNKLFNKSKDMADNSNNVFEKAMGNAGMFMASIVNEDRSADSVMMLMQGANKGRLPHPIFDLLNEFVGRTPDNARIYDMIKLVRSMVQQLRQKFREDLPRILDERYSRPLTKQESELLFRGLAMTDLAALFGDRTEAQILDLLKNPGTVAQAIRDQEEIIRGIDQRKANLLLQKSKELAEFMNDRTVSGNLLRNARAIAHLWNEPNVRQPRAPSDALIKAIDQVTSLYALDGLSQEQKTALSTLVNEQSDGVTFTMSYLVGQRIGEQEKVNSSDIAKNNHYKGYIPATPSGGNNLIVDLTTPARKAELEMLGYEYMGSYVGSDIDTVSSSRGYYFSPVGRPMFNQGIIQNVRSTASGVDPNTGLTNMYSTGGAIMSPKALKEIIDEMNNDPLANGTSDEPLMPVFSSTGRIIAFERSVDPLKEALLDRDMNLSKAIGQWRGRQAEEGLAAHYNSQLVSKLKAIYDEQKLFRSTEFVNLAGPIADPVVADAVKLINQQTWKLIEEQFGEGEFWVRRDMLNDVIGYRQASIGDVFTGISRLSPTAQKALRTIMIKVHGVEAYRKFMGYEQLLRNFVTDARVTIVVKSVIVPMANLAANFIQLMSRGVPVNDIMKGMPKKTAEVKSYVEGRARLIEVEAEIRASTGNPTELVRLKREKQAIEDAQRRLTIWPLIEAGEFASISDVGISQEEILLSSGRLNAYVESMTNKLPDSVKTLGKYAIVAKDTSLYKGLQRAVEYGDFLGKAVLYDYLTETKGKTQEEALASVTEEFVNYDRLPGRSRGYLEAVGLMWFWNFKIRSTKIALSMIRNNPLHAMLAMGPMAAMGMAIPGSPIFDNAGAIMMDPQRMAYSLGVDQALSAHNLNPWWNLFT